MLRKKSLRLFCSALFRARPGQLLVLRIYKEGSHENRPAKVALVGGGMVQPMVQMVKIGSVLEV